MNEEIPRRWDIHDGEANVIATAIHSGHDVRPEIARLLALDDAARLREEDPYTDRFARTALTQVVVHASRFEFDLNRPRADAVYTDPDAAWGFQVWRESCPDDVIERSAQFYDAFYRDIEDRLERTASRYGPFVVLDLHAYNHRREGSDAPPAPPEENPEVNVGTGSLDRVRWGSLVDRFERELADAGSLDVRENVRFKGGHLSRWIHERFAGRGCCLALEFKKTFMDEWTGEPYEERIAHLADALEATIPGLEVELRSAS